MSAPEQTGPSLLPMPANQPYHHGDSAADNTGPPRMMPAPFHAPPQFGGQQQRIPPPIPAFFPGPAPPFINQQMPPFMSHRPMPPPPPMMMAPMDPWREATAPDGKVYYYNVFTRETTWTRPPGMPAPLAPGWTEARTPEGTVSLILSLINSMILTLLIDLLHQLGNA